MAFPPLAIDEAVPGDSDVVSQFPAAERTFRNDLEDFVLTEHDTYGHHKIQQDTTTNRDADANWSNGSLFYNTTLGQFQVRVAGSWVSIAEFAKGGTVKVPFYMASAPTGWTQVSVNDRVLRVMSSSTGVTGGSSWTISGLTHAHTHSVSGTTGDNSGGTKSANISGSGDDLARSPHQHSFSVTSGAASTSAVSSDGAWRPLTADVMIASKD